MSIMPGMCIACGSGASCPRARSQRCIMPISSCCEIRIRSPSLRMSSLLVFFSSSATMSSAWAWWWIIPCMKVMSAWVAWTFDKSLACVEATT